MENVNIEKIIKTVHTKNNDVYSENDVAKILFAAFVLGVEKVRLHLQEEYELSNDWVIPFGIIQQEQKRVLKDGEKRFKDVVDEKIDDIIAKIPGAAKKNTEELFDKLLEFVVSNKDGFVIAGSYADFLYGRLKHFRDIDVWFDDPTLFYEFLLIFDDKYGHSVSTKEYQNKNGHKFCKTARAGLLNLILVPRELDVQNSIMRCRFHRCLDKGFCVVSDGLRDILARLCICKLSYQKYCSRLMRHIDVTVLKYYPMSIDRVVKKFPHSVTRCGIEYSPLTGTYLLKESSVVGKPSLVLNRDATLYPDKHFGNVIGGDNVPNELKSLAEAVVLKVYDKPRHQKFTAHDLYMFNLFPFD